MGRNCKFYLNFFCIYIVIMVNSVQAGTSGHSQGDVVSSDSFPVTHQEAPTTRVVRQLAHIFRAPYIPSPKKFKHQPYKIVSKRKKYPKGPMPPFPGNTRNQFNNNNGDNPVLVMRQRRPPPTMTTTTTRSVTAQAKLQFLPKDSVPKSNGNNFYTKYKKLVKKDPRYEDYVKAVKQHLHKQWARTSTTTTTTKRPIIRLRSKPRMSQQKLKNFQKFASSEEDDDDDDDDVDENERRDSGSVEDNYDNHLEEKDNLLQYNDHKRKTKKNYSLAFSVGGTNFRFSMAPQIFGR